MKLDHGTSDGHWPTRVLYPNGTFAFEIIEKDLAERVAALLSADDFEKSRAIASTMKFDAETILTYDAERPASAKLGPEMEERIACCIRSIADKPHLAPVYLRDMLRSPSC